MQPQWKRRFGLQSLMIAVVLAAPSLAARRGEAVDGGSEVKIARAHMAPNLISFEPLTDYEMMTLRVKGEGRLVFDGQFAAGEAILFDLFDQFGHALEDGTYAYELTAVPRIPGEIRLAMEAARASGTEAETEARLREARILPARGSMTLSGAFTIVNGEVVDPDLPEESADAALNPGYHAGSAAPQDQVVNDDKIIIGSLCVGFDCINGESFGFDTVRLKENNLRLHFQDTSNSASFPTRDWRWVANDSANGGASYMGLEDTDNSGRFTFRVFSGASSNALVVDAQGDVGLSTLTPVTELHIVDGDTPTLRLEQDGSSGFTPQTWDVAGNETNFFVRDVTNGSRLPFRIRPSAPTSSIDVAGDGDVGLGTSSPAAALHVTRNNDTAQLLVEDTNATNDTSAQTLMELANVGALRFDLNNTGDGHEWTFSVFNNGNFVISKSGTGVNEMLLTPTGNVTFVGSVNGAAKNFKIDHPLDPENKFLYHSSVESPDMMNIYNGNVALDANGEAWIVMPEWFEALNRDFRYQLTAMGGPNPGVYVAEEMTGNRFKIAGGLPNSRLSWQVTGIRHDTAANALRHEVEEEKPEEMKGTYLFPKLQGDKKASHAEGASKSAPKTAPGTN